MASAPSSRRSVPSSPVRFDSAAPNLRPEPLRLPLIKIRTAIGDGNHADAPPRHPIGYDTSNKARDEAISTIHHTASSELRSKASKLGPLVSKFEILDAVCNVDTSCSRAPRLSVLQPAMQRGLVTGSPSNDLVTERHIDQPPLSCARLSTAVGPTDLLPKQATVLTTPGKRSQLPTSIELQPASSPSRPPRSPPAGHINTSVSKSTG
jgi:hypothetical protein